MSSTLPDPRPAPTGAVVTPVSGPEVPTTFWGYCRAFGPGGITVLTWLGAGDIVSAGVAGGNYGYALMWAMVFAIFMRYYLVSTLARHHLCNPAGESVIDGLARLHRAFPLFLLCCSLVWGHLICYSMVVGLGEISVRLTGVGAPLPGRCSGSPWQGTSYSARFTGGSNCCLNSSSL